jgi:ribulose-5-phosphate 4-epimerase/fuculose-1-phosphate aldolase
MLSSAGAAILAEASIEPIREGDANGGWEALRRVAAGAPYLLRENALNCRQPRLKETRPMAHAVADVRPSEFSAEEWALRVDLAACYRIVDYLGWTELIFNHITARLPGPENHFLINPYGLWYDEVTASNLVKIDLAGNIIGESDWPVNPAGFVIHSAIHESVPDAHCVFHTHTTAGMAVACQQGGLRYTNIYDSLIHGDLAYHDFEGITVFDDEKERLVANIGDKHYVILRNHGLLTVGETLPEALQRMWRLNRACEVQQAADAGGQPLIPISEDATRRSAEAHVGFNSKNPPGERVFDALLRKIDSIDPSYKT